MQKLYYRINTKGELLALQVKGRGIGFESLAPGEAEVFNHLRLLNEAQAVLRGLAFITSLHPFIAYLGLCDLAGRLAILGPDRRVPELPLYDHDDLGNCFFTLKRYLDTLLDTIEEPQYEVASFAGIGYSMEAKLRAKWLEEEWQLLISVESPLPPAECANMLEYGGMDMKVSSAALAEEQVLRGLASLTLKHTPDQVPHILPRGPRLAYFQLVRPRPLEEDRSERNKQNANAWEAVRQSKSLAIRLNRSKIVGDLSGRDSVKVKPGSATPELKFTLYALPPDRGGRVRSSASGIR
jgi:type VI secretion system protein ImpJ